MNQIAWLENNISKVEQMLSSESQILKEVPDSFSAQLATKSAENHLADLQQQLKREKEKREKEVLELHLTGPLADKGSIPLEILSKIALHLSNGLLSLAYRQQKGKDPHGIIPELTTRSLDLRLSEIATGSTRLFITSENRPNLFGQSLAEDSLHKFFNLMNAGENQDITNAVAINGIRSSKSIAKLCEVLVKNQLEIDLKWSSPNGAQQIIKGDSNQLINLSHTLNELSTIKPELLDIAGKLTMSSLKGDFEITTQERTIRGKFPEELLSDMCALHLGNQVKATIEKEIIRNPASGYEKQSYTLLRINKDEPISCNSGLISFKPPE